MGNNSKVTTTGYSLFDFSLELGVALVGGVLNEQQQSIVAEKLSGRYGELPTLEAVKKFVERRFEAEMQAYQLVLTLDISGSMSAAQYDGIVYLDDGTQTTRLQMAKDALQALVEEYHSQSDSVSVHLVTFQSSATVLNGGNAYTDLQETLDAIAAINGSGGTNYEDALNKMQDALDADGNGNLDTNAANLSTITYFISDGVPTSGNTTDPVGVSGWDTFIADNGIDSFAVGIGSGISDFGTCV